MRDDDNNAGLIGVRTAHDPMCDTTQRVITQEKGNHAM